MKIGKYLPIAILICIGLASTTADAQENLAQQASAIFQQNCSNCHGPSGSFKEALLIDRTALVDTQVVIPGDPENSEFYKRLLGPTENGPQMPLNLPPLSRESVETIARWITAGAPDWNVQHAVNFITTDAILDTIRNHLKSLDPFDRPSARYFTMTHLYNAGESPEILSDYRIALSKLINSLSWQFEITNPTPIDAAQTIFYIDLRRYEWNTRTDVWTFIEQAYPYTVAFDPETQAGLLEKLAQLQTETGSAVPLVHVDWFLATASLPPLYHDILDLPQTDRVLETQLGVDVGSNIKNAPGIAVWRAGFNDSGVSTNNRVVERHTSQFGAYWKSYDFAGSVGSQNIFTHPLDFTHDGGEIVFNLPNGLQAYLLVDADGNRLDDAPINIVSNPAASDPTVRNGLSCIGCHTQGMKTFTDSVRGAIEQNNNPPYNKEHALRLYPEQSVLDDLVAKDTVRFQQALEKIGGPFADAAATERFFKQHENEPVQRFHELFQSPLSAADAAAAVGLETEAFLTQIHEKQSLKNLGLQTLTDVNGTVKRDAWTANFQDVISALNTPDSILPPVVQRPELIPGASVDIPDPNLRAAIAEALGKAPSDAITVEDMATLTKLTAEEMDIRDITGLEFAINLTSLNIRKNQISDISPLAGLTQLTGLWVARNKISDISPLTKLINIGVLAIYDNEISDLSPLSGLTNLRGLSIYSNPISNIQPLAGMKNLNWIRMSYEGFGDLSPISALISLESFMYWGSGNPIPDLSPLTNLPKLRLIDIRGIGQPDLSPLAQVDTLERFEFWGSRETLPDLSPLVEATNLKELWVINCGITDLTFLQNFTRLERLNLERNNISDVSSLAKLTNLKWLKLTDNPITDFSPLEVLSQNTNILAVGFTFSATQTSLLVGDTFTLNLNTEDISDLAGWQADITFDPGVLEATEITEGDFLQTDGGATFFQDGIINNTAGKITTLSSALISENGVSGTGTLLSVTFIAKASGETQVTLENFEFGTITGDIIPTLPPNITITVGGSPSWDVNQDGRVSVLDLILVSRHLGEDASANPQADVNRDGVINIQDLIVVAQHLGESTDAAAPSAIAVGGLEIDSALIQTWIEKAHLENDGSLAFRHGIANLERLLARFIPEETALLHNYPNPFNPETWIPYQLEKPAAVTVSIHSANGTLIRTLALGHQPAGIYQNRSRAAYWDGTNEAGEPVASGVYFYTLLADGFKATRKMLVIK